MGKFQVIDHPLIQHKLTIIRDKNSGTKVFREVVDEIAMLMAYEISRDLPVEEVEIETPMMKSVQKQLAGKKVAIIPISETVLDYAKDIQSDLIKAGISTELDDRDDLRPGAKFYDQEVRGVPIRLEIGEQEMSNQQITYALRFNSLKGQINRVDIVKEIQQLLDKIQEEMLVKAEADLKKRIFETNDKAEFKKIIKTQAGLAQINWCGETDCELSIKEATGAMSRNMPIDQQHKTSGTCVWCGRPAKCVASFSKAY